MILAPNSGLIRISDQIAGDRYSYMSMLGLVMLAAAGFCWLWRMLSRWRPCGLVIIAMGLGALLGLTAMTRQQCRTWLNSEILWTHALAHGASSSPLAHNNLGNVLYSQGNHQMGVAHYTEALRLNPRYADAHNNLGTILYAQGKHEEAEAHYTEALRLDPGFADAHNNLAMILFHQRRYPGGGGSFHRGAAAQSQLHRYSQQPGDGPRAAEEICGGGGSFHRGGAAQSRLSRGTLQPRPRPRRTGEVRVGGGSLC